MIQPYKCPRCKSLRVRIRWQGLRNYQLCLNCNKRTELGEIVYYDVRSYNTVEEFKKLKDGAKI